MSEVEPSAALNTTFVTTRDRDAYFVIRGYVHQIDQTIHRWLELGEDECLELERGEDIDRVYAYAAAEQRPSQRTLEQVKHLAGNITLKSPPAIEAIANFLDHRSANPEVALRFRFCTTAEAVPERPLRIEAGSTGVDAWLRLWSHPDDETLTRLAANLLPKIRATLLDASRPPSLPEGTWNSFVHFISNADEDEFLAMVRGFEWSIGGAAGDELEQVVVDRLLTLGIVNDGGLAKSLYWRLFVFVARRLSEYGLKRLQKRDLYPLADDVRAGVSAAAEDARLIGQFEERLSQLAERVAALEEWKGGIDSLVQVALRQVGAAGQPVLMAALVVEADFAPPGPSEACRTETVQVLAESLQETDWLAIHGAIGSGKTELARLLAATRSDAVVRYLPLRDLSSKAAFEAVVVAVRTWAGRVREASLNPRLLGVTEVAAAMSQMEGGLFIIDDLPGLVRGDRLSHLLLGLASAAADAGAKIVTLSHYTLPPALKNGHAGLRLAEIPAPPFTDSDVLELFAAYGMPAGRITPPQARVVNLMVSGHATLLAATARFLCQRDWKVDADQLEAIVQHRPAHADAQDAIRRLLREVEDEEDVRLLARLCLITGTFEEEQARMVADVEVPVRPFVLRMDRLRGVWLQRLGEDELLASPLVKSLADDLDADEQRRVRLALANEIIRRKRISIFGVLHGVAYCKAARAWNKAAGFLFRAHANDSPLPDDQLQLLINAGWANEPLPREITLPLALLLRGQQVKALHRMGLETERLLAEGDDLASSADPAESWAVFGWAVLAGQAGGDFVGAAYRTRLALENHPSLRESEWSEEQLPRSTFPKREMLLMLLIRHVTSAMEVGHWLDLLETLQPDEAKRLLLSEEMETGHRLLTERAWMHEHENVQDRRDWQQVTNVLRRFAATGRHFGAELMEAAATDALIVVFAEYFDNLEAAQQLADGALDHLATPSAKLIVAEAMGRQYLFREQPTEAEHWLRRALSTGAERPVYPRLQAHCRLAQAIGPAHAAEAREVVEKGVTAYLQASNIVPVNRVAALGELAVAQWLADDRLAAVKSLHEAAGQILHIEERSDNWKNAAALLAHTVGYYSREARGADALLMSEGESVPPYRGMFLTFKPERAEWYNKAKWELFPVLMCSLAEVVAADEVAIEWAERGLEQARKIQHPTGVSICGLYLVTKCMLNGDPAEGFDLAGEAALAMQASNLLRGRGVTVQQEAGKLSAACADLTEAQRSAAIAFGRNFAGLRAALAVAIQGLRSHEQAASLASEIAAACEGRGEGTDQADHWNRFATTMRAGFVEPPETPKLHKAANAAAQLDDAASHMTGYVALSLLPSTPLEQAVIYHAVVGPVAKGMLGEDSLDHRLLFLPFIEQFWSKQLETRRFAFASPRVLEDELVQASKAAPAVRPRLILRAILASLRVRLPSVLKDAQSWLQEQ